LRADNREILNGIYWRLRGARLQASIRVMLEQVLKTGSKPRTAKCFVMVI
jgi:hypothetical protein